ncbi:MAG: hypothetical protein IAI50_20805, partial [Candidatus Eremiobacteraeota bacterium]|nr:hypothetical protein [Candidatus Eremiobacteraeota bacterium]
EEVELIAALVRYHRKAMPKATHPEWAVASPAVRAKIEGLAGMLRVADGLDRRRLAVVSSIEASTTAAGVHLSLGAFQDITPEMEGARFKADLFERAFGTTLTLEAVQRSYGSGLGEAEANAAEIDAASLSG